MRKNQSKTESIRRCLDVISSHSFKIEVLCLDRAFYSIDVLNFLEERKVPHIIPVVKRGKKIKELLNVSHSCHRYHILERPGTFKKVLVAIKVGYLKGKTGKKGTVALGYAVFGISWTPEKVYQTYRSRFGIESAYRMRNTVKPFTTSRKLTLRFLYAIISFLFENVWVALQWGYFTSIRRGPRKVEGVRFRFEQFRMFVWEGVQRALKRVSEIPVLRYPI